MKKGHLALHPWVAASTRATIEECHAAGVQVNTCLRAAAIPGPYLVVDLGGGSTELVRGLDAVDSARSVDVGCVRLTERHLRSDPPTEAEVAAAVVDIDAAIELAAERVELEGVATVVGLAGSVTTVTAHALGLTAYQPERIHLAELTSDEVVRACEELLRDDPRRARRARLHAPGSRRRHRGRGAGLA